MQQANTRARIPNYQQIKQIIKRKFSQRYQQLCLNGYAYEWIDVLQYQDWSQIKSLWLNGCKITDGNIGVLRDLSWPNLEVLGIYNNQITDLGLRKLLYEPLPQLRQICLSFSNIGNQGLKLLLNTRNLPSLQVLIVSSCQITAQGLSLFPSILECQIRTLDLRQNNIGSIGVKLLIKADLKFLENLYLWSCRIGDEGVRNLIKGQWPNLTELNLNDNQIKMQGCSNLTASEWKKLNLISIQQSGKQINLICLISSKYTKDIEIRRASNPNGMGELIGRVLCNRFSIYKF